MEYDHTQKSPLYLILVLVSVVLLATGNLLPHPAATWSFWIGGILIGFSSLGFRQLTVRDSGDHLLVQFGPLPLFRRRLAYAELETAERNVCPPIEGWGIHLSLGGGWTWNIWGSDVIDVTLTGNRCMRIGTDDPGGLLSFLQTRLQQKL